MKKVFLILLVALLLFTCGCGQQKTEESGQRLLISAVTDTESSLTITKEDLNGNYDGNLRFQNVKDVTITLDDKAYALEDAITDGLITVEEIEAYARIDARNGFCKEIADSRNGVSHFIYRYDGVCDLYFTHDVYETPDGSDPVTTYFAVYNNNGANNLFQIYGGTLFNVLEENYPVDMEDWKLKFEITDASSTGFTLNVHQEYNPTKKNGSHQIGQLQLTYFELFDLNDLSKSYLYHFNSEECPIVTGTTNSFQVRFADAEEFPGELPSGNYRIFLDIKDDFDETDVHPLMRDYHRSQGYWISFDIP